MAGQNPWTSMWVKPRDTIQSIVSENPDRSLWILAFIYGFTSLMNAFQTLETGTAIGLLGTLLLAIVIAPFWGYFVFSIWSMIIVWTGKWLKGQASFREVRAAYAWSNVPMILVIPLWLIILFAYGHMLFYPQTPALPHSGLSLLFFLLMGKLVLAIWSLILFLQALAEVQKFSILRSIGNVILGIVVVIALMMIVWGVIVIISNWVGVS
jgi:hypothetical protein